MARQAIDLTTVQANGKRGESAVSAFTKINSMTDELYTTRVTKTELNGYGIGTNSPQTTADVNNKPLGTIQSYATDKWSGAEPDGVGSLPGWFNVVTYGLANRRTILVTQAYNISGKWPRMWLRAVHDNTYSPFAEVYTTANTTKAADGTLRAI